MKKRLLILALLIFIVSIGCASAAENDASDALALDDGDEVLASNPGTFSELQDLIDNAGEYEEVNLDTDYVGNGTEITIVNKTFIINGNGHTLNASFNSRIFNIDANSEVRLFNITFIGGFNDTKGGAIYSEGSLYLIDCEFTSNAGYFGAAIYSGYSLYVGECVFDTNYADSGGAIYAVGEALIEHSEFINNYADYSAGAIFCLKADTEIYNTRFIDNTAVFYGGSVHGGQILSVFNSYFTSTNETVEILDYFNTKEVENACLYLKNNVMISPAPYQIVYTNVNPIASPVTLEFVRDGCEKGDTVVVAELYDDMENIIRFDPDFIMEVYDGSTLRDETDMTYDTDMGGYCYECNLNEGTYRLTGSITTFFLKNLTVRDGELVVGAQGKTATTLDAAYDLNGSTVTLAAEVTPKNATGTVTFKVNGKDYTANVKNGMAVKTLNDLEDGRYVVRASYGGNENYKPSRAEAFSFTVEQVLITPNVTTTCEVFANDVTITAEIEPSDATGVVSFYIGENHYDPEVKNGKATYKLTGLEDGTYTVRTLYRGDEKYDHAYADDVNFTVNTTSERANSSVATTYEKDGHTVTLIAMITPSEATGTVIFYVNGEEYNPANVTNGRATKKLTGMPDGTYTVESSYSGDGNYYPSNATPINFTISSSGIVLDAPPLVKYYGSTDRFSVTLTEDGNPMAAKKVNITINGNTYERTTDSKGVASMAINLNSGLYPVTVRGEGQEVNTTVTVEATVSGENIIKIFRNATQYYAAFIDTTGKTLANSTAVEFNINGVFYTRYTNEKGVARMNINLNPGEYIITAKNPSSGEMHTNVITVLSSIVENRDLTKYYRNDSQYRIMILADDGSIAKEGVKVTFNINGVFYERLSDAEGYVQLKINLNPGKYIITAEYNGLMASNNITVLNVLFGNDVEMEYKDGSKYTVLLLDGKGNPYPNQTVELNINGVFYYKQTNESGIASLNINLDYGLYIITATYNGLSCSNTVNVTKEILVKYDLKLIEIYLPKSANLTNVTDGQYYKKYNVTYLGNAYELIIDMEHTAEQYKQAIISEGGLDRGTYNRWLAVSKNPNYYLYAEVFNTCFGFSGPDEDFVRSTVDNIFF